MLLLSLGGGIFVKELTYNPLTEKDFNNVFPNYDNSAKKECSVDFIGLSSHGELFDIYKYKLNDMTIDFRYPDIKGSWSNATVSDNIVVSTWEKIPVDSLTSVRCKDIFDMGNYRAHKCCNLFVQELSNPQNYYSYVYVNELEYYFLLYCPDKHDLYYVRKKGW